MQPAADGHEVDLSPEFRLDHRQCYHAPVVDRVLREETETKPCGHHRKRPVLAVAPVGGFHGHTLLAQNAIGIACEFAVVAMDIEFTVDVPDPDRPLVCKSMAGMDDDHHLLA